MHWEPGSEQVREQHTSALGFTDGLLQATWQSGVTPDAINVAVEGFLI